MLSGFPNSLILFFRILLSVALVELNRNSENMI